jgi:6-phosphogluconate dehydrogenase
LQRGIICFSEAALWLCRRLSASQQTFALLCPGTNPAELTEQACLTLPDLLGRLQTPREIWLLEPDPRVLPVFEMLLPELHPGDVIVDAGNTDFSVAIQRQQQAAQLGVAYIDVGIYLNPWGPQYGFALMVGGHKAQLAQALSSLDALAPVPQRGWLHCGPPGSGLFMRQLQREVEQAVARSVSRAHHDFSANGQLDINHQQIAQLWQEGSELRQTLQQQAGSYLQQINPDQPFEAFFASDDAGTADHSWPALELARIIQLAADGSQQFEQQILALMRKAC